MLNHILHKKIRKVSSLGAGMLTDQDSFYRQFAKDLSCAQQVVLIESPFLTMKRISALEGSLESLRRRQVKVVVNTKPIDEHDPFMASQAADSIGYLQAMGVKVLFTVGHHRKLAIIDDYIVWEGSLNILSQYDSCEIMRRTQDHSYAYQLLTFIKLQKWAR